MLLVVKGDERTRSEIWWYSLLLVALTLALPLLQVGGKLYFVSALILGIFFLYLAWKTKVQKTQKIAYQLFGYSIAYLMLLFILIMVDHWV